MKVTFVTLGVLCLAFAVRAAEYCPSGGEIYEKGISWQGSVDIVNEHNKYRKQILDGKVPGQPRGKNIAMLKFDQALANEGRKVSNTCKMEHIIGSDNRFSWVGQNLYIAWSSAKSSGQDWAGAAASWFNEHKNFKYPNKSNGTTGHYTQLIWGKTYLIGCDFVFFYDKSQPKYPYAKLYTCNYGPGGNYNGEAPYELA